MLSRAFVCYICRSGSARPGVPRQSVVRPRLGLLVVSLHVVSASGLSHEHYAQWHFGSSRTACAQAGVKRGLGNLGRPLLLHSAVASLSWFATAFLLGLKPKTLFVCLFVCWLVGWFIVCLLFVGWFLVCLFVCLFVVCLFVCWLVYCLFVCLLFV